MMISSFLYTCFTKSDATRLTTLSDAYMKRLALFLCVARWAGCCNYSALLRGRRRPHRTLDAAPHATPAPVPSRPLFAVRAPGTVKPHPRARRWSVAGGRGVWPRRVLCLRGVLWCGPGAFAAARCARLGGVVARRTSCSPGR